VKKKGKLNWLKRQKTRLHSIKATSNRSGV
jgi:hypothetical protein